MQLAATDRLGVINSRVQARLERAFEVEDTKGLIRSVKVRTLALPVIALLLLFTTPYPDVFYYHALIFVFMLSGLLAWWLAVRMGYRAWHAYVFVFFEFGLLAFTLTYPNPFANEVYPAQLATRFGNFIYLIFMLTGLAFSIRPVLVIWGGLSGAFWWGLGTLWLLHLPDTVTAIEGLSGLERILTLLAEPTLVDIGVRVQEIVVFLIIAAMLASSVARARKLALKQASFERDRSNLARYFAPATVDLLTTQDEPLSFVREHKSAVLFADIIGFTSWAEDHSPKEIIEMLREIHGLMETAVFSHDGTLDKFIGDGMMATFGTPSPGLKDATNALRCAHMILKTAQAWNKPRTEAGRRPLHVAIGLHYGPVVIGDLGTERRLEFAVLGDAVNIASRLERFPRELGCSATISDDLVEAVRAENEKDDEPVELIALNFHGDIQVKGRQGTIRVWTL